MMNKESSKSILIGVGVILLQIAVLDNISIWGYVTPYLYVVLLFLLPYRTGVGMLMIWGFLIGLMIDIFSTTGGLHAMACTMVMSLRNKGTTKLLGVPEKELDSFSPLKSTDVKPFAMVVMFFALVALHHVMLYMIEAMSFSLLWTALWHGMVNAVITTIIGVVFVVLVAPSKRVRF